MSRHYVFSLSTDLDTDLPAETIDAIAYILGGDHDAPESLPQHSFFQQGFQRRSYKMQYGNFPKESYSSELWAEKNSRGEITRRAVNLRLPSLKLEEIYGNCLPFASWLATISYRSGYVGSFNGEDFEDFEPTLLFFYEAELYVGTADDAQSFSTGNTVRFTAVG